MKQDPITNSTIGFDLRISKDFDIMTHKLSRLWVMMPKSFDIPRLDPMTGFAIEACSITTGFY